MLRRRRIKRRTLIAAACAVLGFVALGAAYLNRAAIKETYERLTAPALPKAEAYAPAATSPVPSVPKPPTPPATSVTTTSKIKRSAETLRLAPLAQGRLAPLPPEKLLAVPFMVQAPFAVWDKLHDEACEEASALMVRGFYQGKSGRYDPNEAERLIQDLVKSQQTQYGFFEDTSATETKRFIEAAFPELTVEIVPLEGPDSVKRYIAQGIPVILPADGKTLPNPYFRNGGPAYHMLAVRGYTADRFITNDPGTRRGENFLYTYDGLLNAVHDWNGGDVPHGRRVMIIVRPR